MEIITSFDNKTVKHIAKLKQKKYRDEFCEFFTEGYKNALDTCNAQPNAVKLVVLSETAYGELGEKFASFKTLVVSNAVFDKLAETQNSQGIMCIAETQSSAFPLSDRCILLDRVRDPGNVGTILRTAVACGYDVVLNNCADVYSPKVVRSAMSAVIKCRMGFDVSVIELKKAGYVLIVADMQGDNVFSAKHENKYCVVVGNEAEGVSQDIKLAADKLLSIPQDNIESLNAGVAAGVMMFALRFANT